MRNLTLLLFAFVCIILTPIIPDIYAESDKYCLEDAYIERTFSRYALSQYTINEIDDIAAFLNENDSVLDNEDLLNSVKVSSQVINSLFEKYPELKRLKINDNIIQKLEQKNNQTITISSLEPYDNNGFGWCQDTKYYSTTSHPSFSPVKINNAIGIQNHFFIDFDKQGNLKFENIIDTKWFDEKISKYIFDSEKQNYLINIPQWTPTEIIDGQQLRLVDWQGYQSYIENDMLSLNYLPEPLKNISFVNMIHPIRDGNGILVNVQLHSPPNTNDDIERKIQHYVKKMEANPGMIEWLMVGDIIGVSEKNHQLGNNNNLIHLFDEKFDVSISSSRYSPNILLEMLMSIPKLDGLDVKTMTNPYTGRIIVESSELQGFSNFLNDPSVTLNLPKEVKIGDTFDIIYSWSIPKFSQYVEIDNTQRDQMQGYLHFIEFPIGVELLDSKYDIKENIAQRFLPFSEADTNHTIHLRLNEKIQPNEKLTIIIGNNNLNFALDTNQDKITFRFLKLTTQEKIMLQSQEIKAQEEGISLQNLQCKKEIHVLVIRDNGKNACVKETTAEKMKWKVIR